jgi:hypothetical protein
MLIGGDNLTVKLMTTTIERLCNSTPEDDKIDGHCPAPGQFHLSVRTVTFINALSVFCKIYFKFDLTADASITEAIFYEHVQMFKL